MKAKDLKVGDKIVLEVESVRVAAGSYDVIFVKFKRQDLQDRVNPDYRDIYFDENEEITIQGKA